MRFYGLKTCDTCRKAQKQLRAAGHEFEVIDVRAHGVSAKTLTGWAGKVDWKSLLNTRSTTWRNLEASEKNGVDEVKAIALMAAHPTLIKRPVIENDGALTVGWAHDVQAQFV